MQPVSAGPECDARARLVYDGTSAPSSGCCSSTAARRDRGRTAATRRPRLRGNSVPAADGCSPRRCRRNYASLGSGPGSPRWPAAQRLLGRAGNTPWSRVRRLRLLLVQCNRARRFSVVSSLRHHVHRCAACGADGRRCAVYVPSPVPAPPHFPTARFFHRGQRGVAEPRKAAHAAATGTKPQPCFAARARRGSATSAAPCASERLGQVARLWVVAESAVAWGSRSAQTARGFRPPAPESGHATP